MKQKYYFKILFLKFSNKKITSNYIYKVYIEIIKLLNEIFENLHLKKNFFC